MTNGFQGNFMDNYGVGGPTPSVSQSFGGGGFNYQPFQMPGAAGPGQGGMWENLRGSIGQGFDKIGGILGSEGFQSGMGAFSTLANMYTGFKSLGLAKDQLNFQKKAWNKNYQAQIKDYENTLKDRWTARNASAATRGQSFQGMNEWVGERAIGG